MQVKVIEFKNAYANDAGAHGAYYILSKAKGVKVLFHWSNEDAEQCKSLKGLLASKTWRRGCSEFENIKKCQSKITPKGYELIAVLDGEYYYPGIVMEHVQGKSLGQHCSDGTITRIEFARILDRAAKAFTKHTGMHHGDLNSGNVIYNKRQKSFKVIDLDPDFIS